MNEKKIKSNDENLMIINEEHRADLIRLAKEYKYSMQSYPADENGEPKEAYLEYLSLMYDPELVKIALEFPIMPKLLSLRKLAKKLDMEKEKLESMLEEPVKRGFVAKLGNLYARPSSLQIHDMPFILQENLDSPEEAIIMKRYERANLPGEGLKSNT